MSEKLFYGIITVVGVLAVISIMTLFFGVTKERDKHNEICHNAGLETSVGEGADSVNEDRYLCYSYNDSIRTEHWIKQ